MRKQRQNKNVMVLVKDVTVLNKTNNAYLIKSPTIPSQWIPNSVIAWAQEDDHSFFIAKWARDRYIKAPRDGVTSLSKERYQRETAVMQAQRPFVAFNRDIEKSVGGQLNLL